MGNTLCTGAIQGDKMNIPTKGFQLKPPVTVKFRSKAGISMVEMVIAVSLFAMFSTGAFKLLMHHRKVTDQARAHYTAANIAKNRLERLRSIDFSHAFEFGETNIVVDKTGQPSLNDEFRRSTTISPVFTNLLEVVVTVDIRNRETLAFEGAHEEISSYMAQH